jgi:hypothetical protein
MQEDHHHHHHDENQSPTNSNNCNISRNVRATVVEELPTPPTLVWQVLFNDETQEQLQQQFGLSPYQSSSCFDDIANWTNEKLKRLRDLLDTPMTPLHALPYEMLELKAVVFDSTVQLLQFHPVPIWEAFGLEFPKSLLPDRFFYHASTELQGAIYDKVCHRQMPSSSSSSSSSSSNTASNSSSTYDTLFGKSSIISATGMQQLQATTEMSHEIFSQGKSDAQVQLFDAMIRIAMVHVARSHASHHGNSAPDATTQNNMVSMIEQADLKKKIAYLHTFQHGEQAPHRDFSRHLLQDRRRLPLVPWGLDMPLTSSGLMLNVWPLEQLEQIYKNTNNNKLDHDDDDDPTNPNFQCRLPYTLDVAFRQILLFSGGTVHGGGFRRRPPLSSSSSSRADEFDEFDVTNQEGRLGCFRMHMYLSFAPGRRTHAALEGQDQVELFDDNGVKYSTYLLKSNGSPF